MREQNLAVAVVGRAICRALCLLTANALSSRYACGKDGAKQRSGPGATGAGRRRGSAVLTPGEGADSRTLWGAGGFERWGSGALIDTPFRGCTAPLQRRL